MEAEPDSLLDASCGLSNYWHSFCYEYNMLPVVVGAMYQARELICVELAIRQGRVRVRVGPLSIFIADRSTCLHYGIFARLPIQVCSLPTESCLRATKLQHAVCRYEHIGIEFSMVSSGKGKERVMWRAHVEHVIDVMFS